MSRDLVPLEEQLHEIGEQHQCCVSGEDYANIEPEFAALSKTALLTHANLSVYDLNHHCFLFGDCGASRYPINPVLEWKAGLLSEHYGKLIHPDDVASLMVGHIKAYQLVEALPPGGKLGTTLCCLFRVKNEKGKYRLVCCKMAVFRLDREQNPWLLLIYSALLCECAAKEVPSGYCLGVIDQHAKPPVFICNDTSVTIISERELQLLGLIIAGYDKYQIMEMLNISLHTYNEHRRNLEHHLGALDMPQAIVFALRLGLA
jgi:DNA-binding CsgD family transcriptional regulator